MVKWVLILIVAAAVTLESAEEISFRGEVAVVDLESTFIVVKVRKDGEWTERRFRVVTTTEITSRVSSEDAAERGEAVPIALSELGVGDSVVVRYEVVNGRNVAVSIERVGAEHA